MNLLYSLGAIVIISFIMLYLDDVNNQRKKKADLPPSYEVKRGHGPDKTHGVGRRG